MKAFRTLVAAAALTGLGQASVVHAQAALLGGHVVEEQTARPVVGAVVRIPKLALETRTDSTGAFYFGALEPGLHFVMVRAVGFLPVSTGFSLGARDSLVAQFELRTLSPTLESVRIEADRPTGLPWMYDSRLAQFEERREVGLGRFLDWRVFEDNMLRDLGAILRQHIAGVDAAGNAFLRSARSGCDVQVWVNELPMPVPFDLRTIRAADVIGFEYYTLASVPARFTLAGSKRGGSQCGTAIIWTKF